MYYDATKLVDFCSKKKITTEQFLFCYLTYTNKLPLLYKYCDQVRKFPKAGLEDLEKRGFIENTNEKLKDFPDSFVVKKKFYANMEFLTMHLGNAAEELWDAYPSHVIMADKRMPAKNISIEDLADAYIKKVNQGRAIPEEVMQGFAAQKANDSLGMGLAKWFSTEQWKREEASVDFSTDV
jgi:hypothetical protein